MKGIISVLTALSMVLSAAAMPVSALTEPDNRSAVTFALDSVEAEPDTDINVSLTLNGEYAATALTLFIEYDPAKLTVQGNLNKGSV